TPTGKEFVRTYVFFAPVALLAGKTTRSVTLPNGANQGHLHVFAIGASISPIGPTPTPTPPLPTNAPWTTYLANMNHTGYNSAETHITPASAPHLRQLWTMFGTDGISVQPIEANGAVFWGSWDGNFHATNLSGHALWQTNIGQTTAPGCDPVTVGVASTATFIIANGTPILLVGGGNATFYALNAQ